MLLCTDGDFNVGPSSTDELIDLIEERRRTGITLTVLGFGAGNLNDALMEGVADAGNGIYGVISSEDQAIEYANERMLANLEHIAKDMKIQVELNPEKIRAYRLLGYENRAIADDGFRDDAVDAGEVGAGHAVTALYQLVPAGIDVPAGEGAPDRARLDEIGAVVHAAEHQTRSDRSEFAALFDRALPLVTSRP